MTDIIQIEVDKDIYEYLRSQIRGFRETESDVLRRLLNLEGSSGNGGAVPGRPRTSSPLQELLDGPKFRLTRNATDRFLALLAFAHEQNEEDFERVLEISGRRRKYFGRSENEIAGSGKSTHPRRIPGTGYWVMTNADTFQKREILRKVLRVLGYSDEQCGTAARAVR